MGKKNLHLAKMMQHVCEKLGNSQRGMKRFGEQMCRTNRLIVLILVIQDTEESRFSHRLLVEQFSNLEMPDRTRFILLAVAAVRSRFFPTRHSFFCFL